MTTRRQFLQGGTAALLGASALARSGAAFASPFGLPIGLQLYSVREMLPKDYTGTLKQIAALGYTEVEAAGYYNHSPQEVRSAMDAAGLHCVSAHYGYSALMADFDKTLEFNHSVGVSYIICSSPGYKDPERAKTAPPHSQGLTLEDWRWNADQFNQLGAKVKAAGMHFGYHNHTPEFVKHDGTVPYDELLRLTDPSLVTFEMDCGWVTVGGGDPVAYLEKFPTRISMLHVKDFKHTAMPASNAAPPPSAELGQGTADYHAIFKAAKKANIKHYFVEQEEYDMPPLQALKIDADYMKALRA